MKGVIIMNDGDEAMLNAFIKRYKVHPFVIFLLAYEFYKDDDHKYDMEGFYRSQCFELQNGEFKLHKIPTRVQDYLLEVLSGRIQPRYRGKKL